MNAPEPLSLKWLICYVNLNSIKNKKQSKKQN